MPRAADRSCLHHGSFAYASRISVTIESSITTCFLSSGWGPLLSAATLSKGDSALVRTTTANDAAKYPTRTLEEPGPIMVDGVEEYTVSKIVAHRKIGRGVQYRVQFEGWGPEHERWIAGRELEDNEALELYLKSIV